ncbi:uncharacterized protein LOC115244231 [Formica exsecta]|uniref:uncharacterized protein LOC115244231 n=1 Tax=Formica exsecta TaxID=72781 RepID=UPI001141B227|nr:uncharacterized protein LOC115244231 [Formica exsecta]
MATREQIQEYLDIRDIIDIKVNAVLSKNVSIDTIPEGEERNMIKLTVATVEKKQKYLHEKVLYKEAIIDYKVNFGSNPRAVRRVAAKWKLEPTILNLEIYKHTLTDSNYVFDKDIEGDYISYAQEEELWQYLKWVADCLPCSCRACFLIDSSEYACEFFKRRDIDDRYLQCLDEAASIEWIKKFEMRHHDEIYNLCKKSCNKTCSVASVEPVCSISTNQ